MKIFLNSVNILVDEDEYPLFSESIIGSKLIKEILSSDLESNPEKDVNLYCKELSADDIASFINEELLLDIFTYVGVEPDDPILRNLLIFYDFLDNLKFFNKVFNYYIDKSVCSNELFYFIEWEKAITKLNLPPIALALNFKKYSYAVLFYRYVYLKGDGDVLSSLVESDYSIFTLADYFDITGCDINKKLFSNEENIEYIRSNYDDTVLLSFLYSCRILNITPLFEYLANSTLSISYTSLFCGYIEKLYSDFLNFNIKIKFINTPGILIEETQEDERISLFEDVCDYFLFVEYKNNSIGKRKMKK